MVNANTARLSQKQLNPMSRALSPQKCKGRERCMEKPISGWKTASNRSSPWSPIIKNPSLLRAMGVVLKVAFEIADTR